MITKSCKRLTCACLLLMTALLFVGCNAGNSTQNANNENVSSTTSENSAEKTTIDAFDGLKVSFEGISPRCAVVIDSSECSDQVRSSVTYKTDKQLYANQEIVTITATLSQQAKASFDLKEETMTYEVTNMPAYYTIDSLANTDKIEDELEDYITAEIARMGSTNKLFGIGGQSSSWYYERVESVTSSKGYLLTVKDTKINSPNTPFYNSIRIVAKCHAYTRENNTSYPGDIYVCFILNDVVVSPNGEISWENNSYGITYTSKLSDNTVANDSVYSLADNYDIQETAKTDWITMTPS